MAEIKSILTKKIAQLSGEIRRLELQRSVLETALAAIQGTGGTARRGRPAKHRGRPASRRTGPRRKRGANQQRVLAALGKEPRRLTEIAKKVGISVTNAGAVLRSLIGKRLVVKGEKRGTYLLKVR
jgi:hypothetical protein